MPRGFNFHFLIILLVVSASVIQWVYRKVQEQAAIKRAKGERQRRVTESLRTGRPMPAEAPAVAPSAPQPQPLSHTDARRRLQELAERRQRQLEELRRRSGNPGVPAAASGAG